MVQIAPFKAIRYNPAKVPRLSDVISPPYDVIAVPEYHQLMERHPQNIVRIELPLAQRKEDRYVVAARFWKRWQNQRFLIEDKEPAYYGYEQRFSIGSQHLFRRGFFAVLKIEPLGRGHVRPHERTFPKHKEDRFQLMRATQANISPIFGIFFDTEKTIQSLLFDEMKEKPFLVARDDKGVTHRVWRWKNPSLQQTLTNALRKTDVLIADGHHRYETAWDYACKRDKQRRSSLRSPLPYHYVLIFLCPLADPGLIIQPTHRAVQWAASAEEWRARFMHDFSIQSVTGLKTLLTRLRTTRDPHAFAVAMEGNKLFWLKPRTEKNLQESLPVVYLHEKILKDMPPEKIAYGQDARDMVLRMQRGEANVAFLLPAPDKEAFASLCEQGILLPQKSTYFYPKIGTGFVMRSLVTKI